MSEEKKQGGFDYLGPQSDYPEKVSDLPELPKRGLRAHPMPVEGKEPVENYGNVDFHFNWPGLERVDPADDEWAGKDYPTTRSDG